MEPRKFSLSGGRLPLSRQADGYVFLCSSEFVACVFPHPVTISIDAPHERSRHVSPMNSSSVSSQWARFPASGRHSHRCTNWDYGAAIEKLFRWWTL